MLSDRFTEAQVLDALQPGRAWVPYPPAGDGAAWQALPEPVRAARIAAGEAHLGFHWPPLPATVFLDYARNGNRARFEGLSFARRSALGDLLLAECVEGEGRFVEAIVDGVWAICEESYWGVPAHVGVQRAGSGLPDVEEPTVDLFAAETASLLAWTLHLVGHRLDEVSPLLRARIVHEERRRILDVVLARDDFWWMGLNTDRERRVNNWNPWIVSNWLAAALLIEEDGATRAAHVHKAMRCLDRFIDPYPADGGCDEGPSYWGRAGASLFDALDTLRAATGGAVDLFDEDLVRDIGRFVYRVHIGEDDFVNFADAPAVVRPDAALVYRYGEAIEDADMMAFGGWLSRRQETGLRVASASPQRALRGLFAAAELGEAQARAPQPRDVWLPVIEVMTARDRAGASAGFFVAAKGGHNEESHNHNDVGHFVLSVDGAPVIVDAGVETYTRKTFSAERYDIWTMQSAWHSLPTVGDVQQLPGAAYRSREATHTADEATAQLRLDIASAYPDGTLARWQRTVRLERGVALAVTDDWELGAQAAGPLTLSLLTACQVGADGVSPGASPAAAADAGDIELAPRALAGDRRAGAARLHWEIPGARVAIDEQPISDKRLGAIWGTALQRIRFVVAAPASAGTWRLRFTAA